MGAPVTIESLRSGFSLIDWDKLVAEASASGEKARAALNPYFYSGSLYLYIYPDYYSAASSADYIAITLAGKGLAASDQPPYATGSLTNIELWSNKGQNADFLFAINLKNPISIGDFLASASKHYDASRKVFDAESFVSDLGIVVQGSAAGSVSASYQLTPSAYAVNEGSTLATKVTTTGVPAGTKLYWQLSGQGIDKSDFKTGALTGSGTVDRNGSFSFKHCLAKDLSNGESNETLEIRLFADEKFSTQLGDVIQVTINDTSKAPAPAYKVVPSKTKLKEGETLTTKLIATGLPYGSLINWAVIAGNDITESDFSMSNPNNFKKDSAITIGAGRVSSLGGSRGMVKSEIPLTHYILKDNEVEGPETFCIGLYSEGKLVAQSPTITIDDTSPGSAAGKPTGGSGSPTTPPSGGSSGSGGSNPGGNGDPVTGQVDDYRSALTGSLPLGLIKYEGPALIKGQLPFDQVLKVASGRRDFVTDSDWFEIKNLPKVDPTWEATWYFYGKLADGPKAGQVFRVNLRDQKGELLTPSGYVNHLSPSFVDANPVDDAVGKYDIFLVLELIAAK